MSTVNITFEGQEVPAIAGQPLAIALFAAGTKILGRSPKYHRPRGLFCLEGHCSSCLMRVDGRPNIRSCMLPVRDGLRCERQNSFPDADVDVLRATDWLFPHGLDHHRMMTGTRLGNDLFVKLVRQMGGSGVLPDQPAASIPPSRDAAFDVCIVGAGPAGLCAAIALRTAIPDAHVLLLDEQDIPGGSWLAEPFGVQKAHDHTQAARAAGVQLWSGATAIAHYPEDAPENDQARTSDSAGTPLHAATDGPGGVLAVITPAGLVRVSARRFLYTTGAYDQNLPFADNDRPGIVSARACGRLVFRWGVVPAKRVLIVSDAHPPVAFLDRLITGLRQRQVSVDAASVETVAEGAHLRGRIIAVAALPAPASELLRQHGAAVRFDAAKGGFAATISPTFESTTRHVYAAGDVTGYQGADHAAVAGQAAGHAIAATLPRR